MRKIFVILSLIIVLVLIAGCAEPEFVEKIEEPIDEVEEVKEEEK